ncbi:hypothetical protein NDU88_003550 [Pleurodeles waltl]|uniref:Uncharacterized protein n=1 Tax=Pleurodeles waltl TaxID=8319 RepID=A0AAV7QC24_PLEWA|nr:hypothetical protein NDU88_003550 [Pleurodeles waltl]
MWPQLRRGPGALQSVVRGREGRSPTAKAGKGHPGPYLGLPIGDIVSLPEELGLTLPESVILRGDAQWTSLRQALPPIALLRGQLTLSSPMTVLADPRAIDATYRILQEITAVGRRLETRDLKITDLSAASVSIRTDIACFSEKVADLDQASQL